MYYVLSSREELIRHLPKGGVGAEIGVAEGTFSAALLAAAEPKELHLIDPWSHLETGPDPLLGSGHLEAVDRAAGGKFAPPAANPDGDVAFAAVAARFEGDARVRLHRQFSYKAAGSFADGMFDFVYIDGDHHYEFALRDLQDFAAKLKPGGLLFGHDFFEDAFAREENYGVVDAVNAFLKRSDFRFLMLTAEPFSTFCLARRLDDFAGAFLHNVLESELSMVELPDSVANNYRDKSYRRRNGSAKRIPSFMSSRQFQLV
ncbi:MAG TPA: class I SAM-dependent methyltransferase [Allosphingosinicella sp.]